MSSPVTRPTAAFSGTTPGYRAPNGMIARPELEKLHELRHLERRSFQLTFRQLRLLGRSRPKQQHREKHPRS